MKRYQNSGFVETLKRGLLIKDVGNGPALNIRWKLNSQMKWQETAALEEGTARETALHLKTVINQGKIECMFESINGVTYITKSEFSGEAPDLDLRHTFKTRESVLRSLKARSLNALETAVSQAIPDISSRNAQAWFRHCGYGL